MKDRSVRIVIEKPCAQDFGAMPKAGAGLYCSQCDKVVTDFTRLGDDELMRVLGRKTSAGLCGTFYQGQLERVYTLPRKHPKGLRSLSGLLMAGLLSLRPSLGAQTLPAGQATLSKAATKPASGHPLRSIRGKLIHRQTKAGIAGTVRLYADKQGTQLLGIFNADTAGFYEVFLPDTGPEKFFRLVYSGKEVMERSLVADRDKLPGFLAVSLAALPPSEVSMVCPESEATLIQYHERQPDRSEEKVFGGIQPHTVYVSLPLHERLWLRLKHFFRKPFKRRD